MKKLFIIVALVAFMAPANVSNAQDEQRKGYIGIAVGPAFLTGDVKDIFNFGTGVEVGFNFGYLFSPNIGVSASIFGTTFPVDDPKAKSDLTYGLSGLLFGPLFSTASPTGKVEFDFRPTIGFANGTMTLNEESGSSKKMTFAAGVGGSLRWNCWRRVSLSANLDYYYGKPKSDDDPPIEMGLSSFGISFGINYRLK